MLQPIYLSLRIALISTTLSLIIGSGMAYLLTHRQMKGRAILETLITLPLVLPPTVIGYGLLILFGRNAPLGRFLYQYFGLQVVFSTTGAVIAATVVALPLMYQSIKAAFSNIDPIYERAAATLGAGRIKIFFTIILPLAWTGILSGTVLAFARALGEFGATLMIAGNIPGRTQTIPLAIYFAVETGNTSLANKLVALMTIFSFLVIFLLNIWLKKKHYITIMREENAKG